MSKYILTVDGGTTNTRVYLFDENFILIGEQKREVGVRNTAIDGNNYALKKAVKEMVGSLSELVGPENIERVLIAGMLTSNVGIYELPHLIAPVSVKDFAAGSVDVTMQDICDMPITVIPGVKNYKDDDVTLENICSMDMMRGEEVQTLALLEDIPDDQGMVLVLPGSHTKVVIVNGQHLIKGCLTCMTGELIQILTQYSILADATGGFLVGEPDEEYLIAGYNSALGSGSLARAGFLTRICNTFVTKDKHKIQSFLLGAVLENDIAAIKNSEMLKELDPVKTPVRIIGKEPLAGAIAMLMKKGTDFADIGVVHENAEKPLSAMGALKVYKLRGVTK